jgi:two-component system, OmpR family, copper resistance phosphate regulon response regulator CusR
VRLLIVEDEPKLAGVIAAALHDEGHDVQIVLTGDEGLRRARAEAFDGLIVDIMLPGMSGLDLLRDLRMRRILVPVLLLTARDAVEDRVHGLDLGADDYLAKPFALPELLARVRALLRRGRTRQELRLTLSDLELDLVARRASRAGRLLDLTGRELDLLEYLLRYQGHPVSREMLARDVWREPNRGSSLDNVIDVQISRLRRKVDEERTDRLIHTVRGVGFVLREGS